MTFARRRFLDLAAAAAVALRDFAADQLSPIRTVSATVTQLATSPVRLRP